MFGCTDVIGGARVQSKKSSLFHASSIWTMLLASTISPYLLQSTLQGSFPALQLLSFIHPFPTPHTHPVSLDTDHDITVPHPQTADRSACCLMSSQAWNNRPHAKITNRWTDRPDTTINNRPITSCTEMNAQLLKHTQLKNIHIAQKHSQEKQGCALLSVVGPGA